MSFGVYIHVPFCARRCDYCAFATWTDRDHLIDAYLDACAREITAWINEGALDAATSIYVGGGTPSRVDGGRLGELISLVPVDADAEVTVECNPEDASVQRFARWRDAGVTRVSFGVQSMVAHVLGSLGRVHDSAKVRSAVELAKEAGFSSFNLDLIFGAKKESDSDWRASLDAVLGLDPPHVSAYALTVEPGTPLAADPGRHPDPDVQAERYEEAERRFAAAGLEWYEVSNWALPGHACAHNQLYWDQGDYVGFGCSAHSHKGGRRWWNVRTPERYIAALARGCSPVAGEELLDPERRAFEAAALALRTMRGVPKSALAGWEELVELGLVEVTRDDRAVLSVRGRLMANEIAARLVPVPCPR